MPSFTIYAKSLSKRNEELSLESAIRTQKRMIERRGVKQARINIELLRRVFELTQDEKHRFGVDRNLSLRGERK